MALRDDIRGGTGRDATLDSRVVTAVNPAHTGRVPDLTGDWNDLLSWVDSLPGVKWRMGHDRMGPPRDGEPDAFYVAISTNNGANRFAPVTSTDKRRALIEAIVIAFGV